LSGTRKAAGAVGEYGLLVESGPILGYDASRLERLLEFPHILEQLRLDLLGPRKRIVVRGCQVASLGEGFVLDGLEIALEIVDLICDAADLSLVLWRPDALL